MYRALETVRHQPTQPPPPLQNLQNLLPLKERLHAEACSEELVAPKEDCHLLVQKRSRALGCWNCKKQQHQSWKKPISTQHSLHVLRRGRRKEAPAEAPAEEPPAEADPVAFHPVRRRVRCKSKAPRPTCVEDGACDPSFFCSQEDFEDFWRLDCKIGSTSTGIVPGGRRTGWNHTVVVSNAVHKAVYDQFSCKAHAGICAHGFP